MSPSDCRLTLFDSKAKSKLRFWFSFIRPQSKKKHVISVVFHLPLPCLFKLTVTVAPHIVAADGCISNDRFTLVKTARRKRGFKRGFLLWVERDYWSLLMSATCSEFTTFSAEGLFVALVWAAAVKYCACVSLCKEICLFSWLTNMVNRRRCMSRSKVSSV